MGWTEALLIYGLTLVGCIVGGVAGFGAGVGGAEGERGSGVPQDVGR